MGPTNFHSADYISKSYNKALDERDDAEEEFDKLDSTTSDEQRTKWKARCRGGSRENVVDDGGSHLNELKGYR